MSLYPKRFRDRYGQILYFVDCDTVYVNEDLKYNRKTLKRSEHQRVWLQCSLDSPVWLFVAH